MNTFDEGKMVVSPERIKRVKAFYTGVEAYKDLVKIIDEILIIFKEFSLTDPLEAAMLVKNEIPVFEERYETLKELVERCRF